MMSNGTMLASDRERENAVMVLGDAYVAGRLNLDELRERAGAAYGARTWEDLYVLIEDIPAGQSSLGMNGLAGPVWPRPVSRCRPGQPVASVVLLALAGLAVVAAVWVSAAAIPLVILVLSLVSAAGCSALCPARPPVTRRETQSSTGVTCPEARVGPRLPATACPAGARTVRVKEGRPVWPAAQEGSGALGRGPRSLAPPPGSSLSPARHAAGPARRSRPDRQRSRQPRP